MLSFALLEDFLIPTSGIGRYYFWGYPMFHAFIKNHREMIKSDDKITWYDSELYKQLEGFW